MLTKIKLQVSVLITTIILTANSALAQWNAQKVDNLPWLPGLETNKWNFNIPESAANKFLASIKNIINRALGLLAFVAIVILLIAWFKMLFFAQDDWEQKKAFATVKNVAIALIFIGISWLIVSGIFWFVDIVTK